MSSATRDDSSQFYAFERQRKIRTNNSTANLSLVGMAEGDLAGKDLDASDSEGVDVAGSREDSGNNPFGTARERSGSTEIFGMPDIEGLEKLTTSIAASQRSVVYLRSCSRCSA